jgi:hypothetical protein
VLRKSRFHHVLRIPRIVNADSTPS